MWLPASQLQISELDGPLRIICSTFSLRRGRLRPREGQGMAMLHKQWQSQKGLEGDLTLSHHH